MSMFRTPSARLDGLIRSGGRRPQTPPSPRVPPPPLYIQHARSISKIHDSTAQTTKQTTSYSSTAQAIDRRGHGEAAHPEHHLHRHLLLRGVRVRPEAELAGAGHGGRRWRQAAVRGRGGGGVRRHRRRALRPPGGVPVAGRARLPPLLAPDAPALPQVRRTPRLRLRRHRRRRAAPAVPHQDPGTPARPRPRLGRRGAVRSVIRGSRSLCLPYIL